VFYINARSRLIAMMSIRYWQSESRSLLIVLHEWTV